MSFSFIGKKSPFALYRIPNEVFNQSIP